MSIFGELLTPGQLAEELQMNKSQLSQWRYRGEGPPFVKQGNFIRYRREDVEAWLKESLHTRTDRPLHP